MGNGITDVSVRQTVELILFVAGTPLESDEGVRVTETLIWFKARRKGTWTEIKGMYFSMEGTIKMPDGRKCEQLTDLRVN